MIENTVEEIKLKKGVILHSPKYGWTRKITKMKLVEEEVHLKNLDVTDERSYTFTIDNTLKNIKNGIYQIIKNDGRNKG